MRLLTKRTPEQGPKIVYFVPIAKLEQAFCGHKIDIERQPTTNCNQCWTFFFIRNQEFTQTVAKALLDGKDNELHQRFGSKFVKKAKWFFAAVAKAKEVSEAINKELEAEQLASGEDVQYSVVFDPKNAKGGIVEGIYEPVSETNQETA